MTMAYQDLLNALIQDTRSTDLRMKKHASHPFEVGGEKSHVTFEDLYGCRYIYDMDEGRRYDRDAEEDHEASIPISGKTVRKAHLYDGMALFVYSPRDFASDYDRDNWIRRKILLGVQSDDAPRTVQHVHWIWMRIDERVLDPKIIRRNCASWFALNPPDEVVFHLWTNLRDSDELAEWLANVPDDDKLMFLERTRVYCIDETCKQFEGHSIDLSDNVCNPSTKDLFMMTDVLRLVILKNHGGYYADFNDVLCLCPLKTIAQPKHDIMLVYEGSKWQRAMNNFFVYAKKSSPEFDRILSEIVENHGKIGEYVAQGYFPKALTTVAANVLDRILGGIKPPFNPYDIMSIASDIGDLRYAVSNALPDDNMAYRLVFGNEYLDMAREIIIIYRKVIDTLGLTDRLGPIFSAVYDAYACPWTLADLCEFLNKTFETDPSIAEDLMRIRNYLNEARKDVAKSSDLCTSSALFMRIFQFVNIGRHVAESDRVIPHDALCHGGFDVDQKYHEFKFDTFLIHVFDSTSKGDSKTYDASRVLL